MSVFTEAIYNQLKNDTELVNMVNTYNGLPAIFTIDPVPGDAVLPYIVISGNISDAPYDTKTNLGRDITRDIRCYTAANGSVSLVESMAERVRHIFHRKSIPVEGYHNVLISCTGPITSSGEDAYGQVVTVRFLLEEVI